MGPGSSRETIAAVQVSLDTPRDGERLTGSVVNVQGWAHDETSPVGTVDLLVDGALLGRAGLAWPRPDVAAALADPRLGLSGFARLVTLPRSLRTGDPLTLQVRARLLDGRELTSAPVRVHPAPAPGPVEELVRPAGVQRPSTEGPLRAVWLARSLDRGGSQLRMAETLEHLTGAGGWASTVLSPYDGPLRARLERAGVEVRLVDPVPLDDPTTYLAAVKALVDRLRDADLAVAPTVTSFPLVHAALLAGVPAVQRVGEATLLPTVTAWLGTELHPAVEEHARAAMAGAELIWTNAHAVEALYRGAGYDGRWRVVHTGRLPVGPTLPRAEARQRLGVPDERRLLVFPATVWPVKGQGLLAEAVRLVRADHPDLLVAMVGDDGHPYAGELRDHLAAHGLTDHVRVEPFQDDLSTWWSAADGLALTAEQEALPGALVEGMSHALPALATRAGDTALMVEDERSGWLADPDDLGALVDAVRRAGRADLATWRAYGARAAERCAQEDDRATAVATVARLLRGAATARLR